MGMSTVGNGRHAFARVAERGASTISPFMSGACLGGTARLLDVNTGQSRGGEPNDPGP